MNKAENIIRIENPFSFSSLHRFSTAVVSDENISRVRKGANDLMSIMKNAVNNFLKTPEEIEAEFYLVLNSYKSVFPEQDSVTDLYDDELKHKDGYMNTHLGNEVLNLSGYMEENY